MQRLPNRQQYPIAILPPLAIPEAQFFDPLFGKKLLALQVALALLGQSVLEPVEFQRKTGRRAEEIQEVEADGMLTAEFETGEASGAQSPPQILPPVLLAQRWLGLRTHDGAPTVGEILSHLVGWSVLFEIIGPHWMRHATGDPLDVVAYALGALVAGAWWQRARFLSTAFRRH